MSVFVYIFGEKNGEDIKIGHTADTDVRKRLRSVNAAQTAACEYVLLAAVRGSTKDEAVMKRHFAATARTDKGRRTEYFHPSAELVQYANWLRSQWFATANGEETMGELPLEDPTHWLPDGNGRSIPPPAKDELLLVQAYEDPESPLYNTVWSWMVSQKAGVQDYFTPPEIICAARDAMGGLDLDAASHWLANKTHQIPDYFHTGRSAFENRWHGKVWLNPPYGNNDPWFKEAVRYIESGDVEQLCMISPMHAFQTRIAQPFMALSSGLVLLSPTPKFWGNKDPSREGTNLPHGIVYIGSRAPEFFAAFAPFGFPVRPA